MATRVFSTASVETSPTWSASTTPLPMLAEGSGPGRVLPALRNARRALRAATRDDVVVFTDEHSLSGGLFGLFQRCRRSWPTLVRTDPIITMPRGALRKTYLQASLAGADCIIVWAPAVIDRYHQCLGVPLDKMTAVPFHHTLAGFRVTTPAARDFLFSGGNSMRDYPTLIEAVRGLPIPVRIATHWQPPPSLKIPPNVTIQPADPDEFGELMAAARFVVLPLRMDNLRTTGQQSYLNAMALGKAVIVGDDKDAPYYIENNKTGLLTPGGDVAALRQAILYLLDNPEVVRAMGTAARQAALPLNQEYTYSRVLSTALDVHRRRREGRG
jgi:glycosyltransferase involved in cell wall biosynthesis